MPKIESDGVDTINANPKRWPKHYVWPAPIGENEGYPWDEDIIPEELDPDTQELVDIKDYFDGLRDEGILDEDYSLNSDYSFADGDTFDPDSFIPEMGAEYWDNGFVIEAWRDDLSDRLNMLKIEAANPDPVSEISRIIKYHFINENLLRQAFTRRAFQVEYHLSGCCEELEFMGDSILNLYVTKELMRHFSSTSAANTDAPFRPQYDEGELSKLKSQYVCKEHLSKRCTSLSLDSYILYATGEEQTDSSREDAIEALIGAVVIDCSWNWDTLESVIDKLIHLQINRVDSILKKSHYEIFNAWHQRTFGFMPEYEVYKRPDRNQSLGWPYYGHIKFCVPKNNEGITDQVINYDGESRSQVRELLAEFAYEFVVKHGLWMNLKDAKVVPELDKSINQLQELYQKGYIGKAEYTFEREGKNWRCICCVNDIAGKHGSYNKATAKKYAAYETLVRVLGAGGCPKEWFDKMVESKLEAEANIFTVDVVETPDAAESIADGDNGIGSASKKPAEQHVTKILSRFPDGPLGLKYAGLVDVLNQIPEGQIITERVLLKWLGEAYQMENLMLLYDELPRPYAREKDVPFHRFLTTSGLIDEYYAENLKAEGHNVVETKTKNWRVLDYKETMVDVTHLNIPDKAKAIGHAEHFLNFFNDETRENLEKGLRERGVLR